MTPKAIGIIGLGLMGGSLAVRCRKKYPKSKIIAVSRNKRALVRAKRKRWIHAGETDLKRAAQICDFFVLCTPVDTFPGLLSRLDHLAKPETLVTDVGSVKACIRGQIKKKWRNIRFVSAHPMAGSHERGFEAAFPDLYDHGHTFLIRSPSAGKKAYSAVKNFWKRISPSVVEVSAESHDEIVAAISHLPHMIAACLMLSTPPKALKLSSSGFRDVTRIAAGHPSVWLPIFRANHRALKRVLAGFARQIRVFSSAQTRQKDTVLRRILAQAMKKRSEI